MPKARPKSLSRITSLGFPAWPWSCSDTSTFLTRLCSAPAREKGTFSNFLKSTGVQTHPEQSCGTWEASDKNPNMGKGRNREADGWISYNPSFPPAQDTSCNPRDVPVPAGAQECQPWIPDQFFLLSYQGASTTFLPCILMEIFTASSKISQ